MRPAAVSWRSKGSRQHETHVNFDGEVVGPAGIDDVFQDELILGGKSPPPQKKNTPKVCTRMELEILQDTHDGDRKALAAPSLASR